MHRHLPTYTVLEWNESPRNIVITALLVPFRYFVWAGVDVLVMRNSVHSYTLRPVGFDQQVGPTLRENTICTSTVLLSGPSYGGGATVAGYYREYAHVELQRANRAR